VEHEPFAQEVTGSLALATGAELVVVQVQVPLALQPQTQAVEHGDAVAGVVAHCQPLLVVAHCHLLRFSPAHKAVARMSRAIVERTNFITDLLEKRTGETNRQLSRAIGSPPLYG